MATRRAPTSPATDTEVLPPRGADPQAWHALVNAARAGGDVADPGDPDPEEVAEVDAVQRVREVIGNSTADGVRVSVYRRSPMSKLREWCADYSPDQFVVGGLPMILNDLGPGDYEWRAIGGVGILGRGSFKIAANARSMNPAAPPMGTVGTAGPVDAMTRVLESLAQGQAAILQALTNQAQQPRADPMADMERMMGMARLFREMSGPAAAQLPAAAPTLLEQIQTLRAVKEFVKENASDTPDGEGGDPDNPMSLVRPVLDVVKAALAQRGGIGQAPALPAPGTAMGGEAIPPLSMPESLQAPDDEDDETIMKSVLSALLEKAKAGDLPSDAGQFVFQSMPDSALPILKRADAVALLLQYAPALVPHETWLKAVHANCMERLQRFESKDKAG